MQTIKLNPKAVEDAFHPCHPFTKGRYGVNASDALHRLIYSQRLKRYFTLDRLSGKFLLMSRTDMPVVLKRQTFPVWYTVQEFDTWTEVLDWSDKQQAVICLPQPVSQVDVLIDIYRLVFGKDWDRAVKIDGWPECNNNTWMAIAKLFQQFDRQHHPDVLPGGRWMNNGFSSDGKDLADWEVRLCGIITADTPFRYVIKRWIMEDSTMAERHHITKHYQGYDLRDDLDTQYTWEDALKLCVAPEPLAWERTQKDDYMIWTSQWVTA